MLYAFVRLSYMLTEYVLRVELALIVILDRIFYLKLC
jgi:hypothetical protein